MKWPFGSLQPLAYQLLMADPPWHFKLYSELGSKKSAQGQYRVMSLDDIAALPVDQLAAPECVLFMWSTFPMLPQAFGVMEAWGFTYKTGGVWHKRTKNGKTAFGTGYRVRSAAEPWLLGVIGNPKTPRTHRNLIEGLARQHSRKPSEAYSWCESYMPEARRADLFAREQRRGWDAWGAEATKFNQRAA
jgi:N6-adenosine-specific RNA methylase IME4